jgi:hypothetical protein
MKVFEPMETDGVAKGKCRRTSTTSCLSPRVSSDRCLGFSDDDCGRYGAELTEGLSRVSLCCDSADFFTILSLDMTPMRSLS